MSSSHSTLLASCATLSALFYLFPPHCWTSSYTASVLDPIPNIGMTLVGIAFLNDHFRHDGPTHSSFFHPGVLSIDTFLDIVHYASVLSLFTLCLCAGLVLTTLIVGFNILYPSLRRKCICTTTFILAAIRGFLDNTSRNQEITSVATIVKLDIYSEPSSPSNQTPSDSQKDNSRSRAVAKVGDSEVTVEQDVAYAFVLHLERSRLHSRRMHGRRNSSLPLREVMFNCVGLGRTRPTNQV